MTAFVVPVLYAMLQLTTFTLVGFVLPLYYFARVSKTNPEDILSSLFFPAAATLPPA